MKVTYRKDFDLGCGELRKENRICNYSGLSNYQVNKRNKKKKHVFSRKDKLLKENSSKQNNVMHERKKI